MFANVVISMAATRTSTGSGNWTTGGTWSGGVEPDCGDSIIIAAGHTVTTTSNKDWTGCGTNMVLVVRGTLQFGNGDKYKFPCNSRLYVFGGGRIVSAGGGGNSNNIQICGNTEWQAGDGTYTGPGCMPPTLPGCGAVLPITLTYFGATRCETNAVCLKWNTSSEKNNDHYDVMRSENGYEFAAIETVKTKAPGGNSRSPLKYETKDTGVLPGMIYYRLKQVDIDGSFSYSDIVVSDVLAPMTGVKIYPNPNSGTFTLGLEGEPTNPSVEFVIRNNMGHVVATLFPVFDQSKELAFDLGKTLSPGVYFCDVLINGEQYHIKLVIN